MGQGAVAAGVLGAVPLLADTDKPSGMRRVLVLSDLHIGRKKEILDGAVWFSRALEDIRKNVGSVSYAVTLGDISQHGRAESIRKYLDVRKKSAIPKWFELAGNHEYRYGGIKNYVTLVRNTDPYLFIDGNIVWFFISDEKGGRQGDITDSTVAWLKKNLALNKDKVLIVCSHQIPADTINKSDKGAYCIHPKEKIADILATRPIDLWLCGHEHHGPYVAANRKRKNNTTFINVASMSHAYGTKKSQSFILEFKQNEKKIMARRRTHDDQCYTPAFDMAIPLRGEIAYGQRQSGA